MTILERVIPLQDAEASRSLRYMQVYIVPTTLEHR